IDLPMMAKINLGSGFNFFGGPQVSFLLSNNVNVNAGALGFSAYNNDFEWRKTQRTVDLGLAAGLGYQFQNGLNLSGSYDMGLTTIDDGSDYETYNHGFKASVGFKF
ncbi:MAG: outer membrane beta-barrel protein, partial [Rufibacter sp.]